MTFEPELRRSMGRELRELGQPRVFQTLLGTGSGPVASAFCPLLGLWHRAITDALRFAFVSSAVAAVGGQHVDLQSKRHFFPTNWTIHKLMTFRDATFRGT